MAERAKKEAELGRKLTGPSRPRTRRGARRPRRANTTDPHSRIIALAREGVLQGYNAQAAATADQVVLAAEVTATTNDQPHFVPMATAVAENLTEAGHPPVSVRSSPTPGTGLPPTAPPMSAPRC